MPVLNNQNGKLYKNKINGVIIMHIYAPKIKENMNA